MKIQNPKIPKTTASSHWVRVDAEVPAILSTRLALFSFGSAEIRNVFIFYILLLT